MQEDQVVAQRVREHIGGITLEVIRLQAANEMLSQQVEKPSGAGKVDQETARALADAGYMQVSEYLRLCEENGWESQPTEK